MYTNYAYPATQINPGDTPFYAPWLSSTDRTNVDNKFALKYKSYHKDLNMDMALVEAFYELHNGDYSADVGELMLGFVNLSFLTLFEQAVLKWGRITPE